MRNSKLPQAPIFQPGRYENVYNYAQPAADTRSTLKLVWPLQQVAALQTRVSKEEIAAIVAGAQEKERKLLGQELHDNVNQILSTVRLFIEMLHPADARDTEIRQKTVEYVALAIEEIRKISGELVKPKQNDKGLLDSIQQIIDDIHFSTPIRIVFKYNKGIECLNPDKKITVLRIVQEQLKNVLKYSKATLVNIDLHSRNEKVSLVIKDNGIGFDPEQTRQGIGLFNIKERAQSHNGFADLQAAEGCGCTLSVSLPHK